MIVLDPHTAYWIQQLLNAVRLASLYVPLAMAYALVQGITNKVFLSFGDFAIYATFAAIYAALTMQSSDVDPWIILVMSLMAGLACAAALGYFAAKQLFIPLRNKSGQALMIASIGMSIVLQELMRINSGGKDIWLPSLFDQPYFVLVSGTFPVQIGVGQIVALIVSLVSLGIVMVIAKFTRFGLFWQACAQNETLAKLTGVDTDFVLRLTCMMSAMLASVAGWIIITTSGGISFHDGIMLGFKALFASVIGGFGTIAGAIKGGVFLAVAETLWTSSFQADYRDVAVFVLIVIMLIFNPDGLHANYSRRESEI